MFRTSACIALAIVSLGAGCKEGAGSTPAVVADPTPAAKPSSTTPAPAPTPSAAPSSTSISGFPPVDDSCATDSDCDLSYFRPDCCSVCAGTPGNKPWIAKVEAFCAARTKAGPVTKCPDTVCRGLGSTVPAPLLGYLQAIPTCKAGHCK